MDIVQNNFRSFQVLTPNMSLVKHVRVYLRITHCDQIFFSIFPVVSTNFRKSFDKITELIVGKINLRSKVSGNVSKFREFWNYQSGKMKNHTGKIILIHRKDSYQSGKVGMFHRKDTNTTELIPKR